MFDLTPGQEMDFLAWKINLLKILTHGENEVKVEEEKGACGPCTDCSCKKTEKGDEVSPRGGSLTLTLFKY